MTFQAKYDKKFSESKLIGLQSKRIYKKRLKTEISKMEAFTTQKISQLKNQLL